ncbi:MAG: T9SS type A sorting domain-containing protein [Bacteroidales bacterium]|jgi:hypothetical protein|nr:T9SS type A sorting domain-containing protein [Bacteroidales bacterium]
MGSGSVITPSLVSVTGNYVLCGSEGSILLSITNATLFTTPTYQWYKDDILISGTTAATYATTEPGVYHVIVYEGYCATLSNIVTIIEDITGTIVQPLVSAEPSTQVLCGAGSVVVLTVTNSSIYSSNAEYIWFNGDEEVQRSTAPNYFATTAGDYRVVVSEEDDCSSLSAIVTVTMSSTETITTPIVMSNQIITNLCDATSELLLTVSNRLQYGAGAEFVWYNGVNEVQRGSDANAHIYSVHTAGSYYVMVIDNNCASLSNSFSYTQGMLPLTQDPCIGCNDCDPSTTEVSCATIGNPIVLINTPSNTYLNNGIGWDITAVSNAMPIAFKYVMTGATIGTGSSLAGVEFNLGVTYVTWTATNNYGVSDYCSFRVVVVDYEPCIGCDDGDSTTVEISCATIGDQELIADLGVDVYTKVGFDWDVTAISSHGIQTIAYSLSGATYAAYNHANTTLDGRVFNVGTTKVLWLVTDNAGNIDTCSFYVKILSNYPCIGCDDGDSTTVEISCNTISSTNTFFCPDSTGTYTHVGNDWNVTATDVHGIDTIFYTLSGASIGNGSTLDGVSFYQGVTHVTWHVINGIGYESTCTFDVTVHETPHIFNLEPITACSGTLVPATVFQATPTSSIFHWSHIAGGDVLSGIALSGDGNIPSFVAENIGTTILHARYLIDVHTPYGCTTTDTLSIIIYPTVHITTPLTAEICSEGYVNYTITSNAPNANFVWYRAANSNIAESLSSGVFPDIYERLTSLDNVNNVVVTYHIQAEANGCSSNPFTLNVIVHPLPQVSIYNSTPISMAVTNIDTVTAITNETIVSWASNHDNVATITMLSDSTKARIVATGEGVAEITVTVVNAYGCTNIVSFIVNVSSAPTAFLTLADNGLAEVCSGATTNLKLSISGGHAPFTAVYTNGTSYDTLTFIGTSIYNFMVTLPENNSDTAMLVHYNLVSVLDANGQIVNVIPSTATIIVNPVATISAQFTNIEVCEGELVTVADFASSTVPADRVSFTWTNSNPAIGLSLSGVANISPFIAQNNVPTAITSTVTVIPTFTCNNNLVCTGNVETFTIMVNPAPDFVVISPDAICEGSTFDFTAQATNIVQLQQPAIGNTIDFFSDIACSVPVTVVAPTSITSYYVRLTTSEGCQSPVRVVTLTVKPLPQLSSNHQEMICSGDQFTYNATSNQSGVTYHWTRPTITGITETAYSQMGSYIHETLHNTTGAAISVPYYVVMEANGCTGYDTIYLTVYPKAYLNNIPTILTLCSGDVFEYVTPTTNITSEAPIITWTRIENPFINEAGHSGIGSISETLTNLTNHPVSVIYRFTISSAHCTEVENVVVVVNPLPHLTSTLNAGTICSGSRFTYTPQTDVYGATYSWTREVNGAVTDSATIGSATNLISQILVNHTNMPIIVRYVITMSANGCTTEEVVEVTVNPTPQLTSTLTSAAICSGDLFNYEMTANTEGTSYVWMRFNNVNIAEASSYGTSPFISETLHNLTDVPQTAKYRIYATAYGCHGAAEIINVVVNPLPAVSITSPTPLNMFVNDILQVTASISANNTAVWTSNNSSVATVIINPSNPTIATVTAIAEGITFGTITITDTITGCQNSVSFMINVDGENYSQLSVPQGGYAQICSGGSTTLQITFTGGALPFIFHYTDGVNTFVDTAYSSIHNFIVTPAANTGNTAMTTSYWLTEVRDGHNQLLTIAGNAITIEVNPVATVSNIASMGGVWCEGEYINVGSFQTTTQPTSSVQYYWDNSSLDIGLTMTGAVYIPTFIAQNPYDTATTATIMVIPIYNGTQVSCQGTSGTFTITVNPKPEYIVANPLPICSGDTMNLTAVSNSLVQEITTANSTVHFYTEASCITEVTTVAPTVTTIYFVKVESEVGCLSELKEVVVTVNPVPVVDPVIDHVLCNNDGLFIAFTGYQQGTIFSWTKSGIINNNINGLAMWGTDFIAADHLTNNTSEVQMQAITVTPLYNQGFTVCTGVPVIFNVFVNPTVVLNSSTIIPTICSGETVVYTPTTATTGATISWVREGNNAIAEPSTSGTGSINEVLTNLTQNVVLVQYRITLSINGCSNVEYVSVLINPTPTMTSATNAGSICSNAIFNYTITSSVSNVTYSWIRQANINITGGAGSGSTNNINELLINSSSVTQDVIYLVTITANGCSSTTEVHVAVEPQLTLTSQLQAGDICSGEYFNYFATSDANVTYTWTRVFNVNINPVSGQGLGSEIHEILENTSTVPQNVEYQITMTTLSGCSSTEVVTVIVNPKPEIAVSESPVVIAMGAVRTITITDSYLSNGAITSANPTIATAIYDGAGNITITAVSIGNTELTYTNSSAFGCDNVITIPVTVTPAPIGTLVAGGVTTICSGTEAFFQITSIEYGKAPWTVEINYIGSASTPTTVVVNSENDLPMTVAVTTPLNTTPYDLNLVYKITSITDSEGSIRTNHFGLVQVTVNPVAVLISEIDNGIICSGEWFDYQAVSSSFNVQYQWTRPAVAGITAGISAGQSYTIHDHLINNTDTAIRVSYIFYLYYQGCVTSDTIFVTVVPTPSIQLTTPSVEVCSGDVSVDILFTTDHPDLPISYIVLFDNEAIMYGFTNILTYQTVTTQGVVTLTLPSNLPNMTFTGNIVIQSNGCSSTSSYPFFIRVSKKAKITQQPETKVVVCEDFGTIVMDVVAEGEGLTYQWYHNDVAITGATSALYEVERPTTSDYGNYFVVVSGSCGNDTSTNCRVISSPAMILQKWDDVIFISNVDSTGNNLQYVGYQWYIVNADGDLIPVGKDGTYQYYQNDHLSGMFVARIFYNDGTSFFTCPYTVQPPIKKTNMRIYPNPILTDGILTIELDQSIKDEDLAKMRIDFYSLQGQIVKRLIPSNRTIEVVIDFSASVYIIKITDAQGEVVTHKIIVN